jgi:hypothetical protein
VDVDAIRCGAAATNAEHGQKSVNMPWQTAPDPDAEAVAQFRRAKRSRFLIDESLGSGAIEFFKRHSLNGMDVWQVGLNGRDDHVVFALAWKHRRTLLTHDEDF